MINRIFFRFGAAEDQPKLELDVTPITVFVGPNNSGKSRVLMEIESYCRRTNGKANDVVVNRIEFMPYSKDEIESEISKIEQIPNAGEVINPGHVLLGKLNPQNNQVFRAQVNKSGLVAEAQNPESD